PAAEKMFREALVIRRNGLGPSHPALATTLNNLAHALREQARFDEAQAAVVEAIEITRAALGDEHPRIAAYTAHLAQIYLERGDAAHAEPLARAALVLRQRVSPGDAWRIAATQSLLGAALAALARYDEAEPLLLEADRVLQDIPGPQGRETAAHRARLAAFRETRRLAASETSESDR
ncbi:MAG TPA: tetratricopeptide repeat protein, partial [Opitutus sp.]|nr:tetratricopeptide repeat protein [Opitutus sp.]